MARHVVILANAEAVACEAAERILRLVEVAKLAKRAFHLVLSGGSTPKRLYEILAKSNMSWDHVHFFWGDERCVGPDHRDSNYKMTYDTLLSKINPSPSHIHRLQGEIDPALSAQDYEKAIRHVFGLTLDDPAIPSFDLVLLGMGADGHTASLFPETQALKETIKWVVANFVPKLEGTRLTLTPIILNRAARIFFLIAGEDKANTLKVVLEGPYNPVHLPSQLIHSDTGKVRWLIDTAASGCLAFSPLQGEGQAAQKHVPHGTYP